MHTWYCVCVHFWHIENNLKTGVTEKSKQPEGRSNKPMRFV